MDSRVRRIFPPSSLFSSLRLTRMWVDAGSTTLVFLTMASTISVVEMATPQQHDPFFSSSSFPLKRAREISLNVACPLLHSRATITHTLFTFSSISYHFSGSSCSPILEFMSRSFIPPTEMLDQRGTAKEEGIGGVREKGGGEGEKRNTGHVSLSADRHTTDRASRHVQSSAHEILKPGALDQGADAEHAVRGESRQFPRDVGHHVRGPRHDQQHRFRRESRYGRYDLLEHFQIVLHVLILARLRLRRANYHHRRFLHRADLCPLLFEINVFLNEDSNVLVFQFVPFSRTISTIEIATTNR